MSKNPDLHKIVLSSKMNDFYSETIVPSNPSVSIIEYNSNHIEYLCYDKDGKLLSR